MVIGVGVGCSVGTGVFVGICVGSFVGDGVGVSLGDDVGLGIGVGQAAGSVPRMKYSTPDEDAIGVPFDPVGWAGEEHGKIFTTDDGWIKGWRMVPAKNRSMSCRQIGAAPKDPATLSIGELSLLPTHTPTTSPGV